MAPGDPELAADLARRAASVAHDGEAIHGAQVVAAMEALAFVEPDLNRLIDAALGLIPRDCVIRRLIDDIREWHAHEPRNWHSTRGKIAAAYGYDKFGGNCHMVPNHALIIHALLHGDDDFQKSLMIVNTSGWDTDCNSGNVGCLLGIKNGLAGIEAGPDWRGPVADRLYLATADGGRAITDAVIETYHVVNAGRALAGEAPLSPKGGARFHFELPGSVQGFQPESGPESGGTLTVENSLGHSRNGARSLALRFSHLARGCAARAATPTFIAPDELQMDTYDLLASPTLYPGQTLAAAVMADEANGSPVTCRLYLRRYGEGDAVVYVEGPSTVLAPGAAHDFSWRIPQCDGQPIATIGIELRAEGGTAGAVYLDYLTWQGAPDVVLAQPAEGGTMWRRAWVNGVDQYDRRGPVAYCPVQNHGTGLLIQGTREWLDYRVCATITPRLATAAGIAARVQGMRRYYALLLHHDGTARLVKARDGETVLAQSDFPWAVDISYVLSLQVEDVRLRAWIDDQLLFEVVDTDHPLTGGGVALVLTEGHLSCEAVTIRPV